MDNDFSKEGLLEYDSRFATQKEFFESLSRIDLKSKIPDKAGIPLWSDGQTVYVDALDSHSLIIGATGSKKTRLLGMPALKMYAYAGESFIATDPKAELYEKTYPLLKSKDYNIIVINFRDPSISNSWNPLLIPYELYWNNQRDRAIEMLTDLVHNIVISSNKDEPYWDNSAADFLLGLILVLFECAKKEEVNFYSLCYLRAQAMKHINGSPFIKKVFYENIEKSSLAYTSLSGTVDVAERTQSCILSVFDQHMRPFMGQTDLIRMLSKNDFSFDIFRLKKTALFLIMPDEKTTYHKLVSIFIKQCYEQLIYEAQKIKEKAFPIRVNFLLDEFSSLPKIKDFPAMITASRSRNIRFNLIIQSDHQLKARYEEESETIKCNCNNWVFLTSRELHLLRDISDLAGMKKNNIPLISVSRLQRLKKERGEALIFHERIYPYVTNLADIDSYIDNNLEAIVEYPKVEKSDISRFDFEKFCNTHNKKMFIRLFSNKISALDSINKQYEDSNTIIGSDCKQEINECDEDSGDFLKEIDISQKDFSGIKADNLEIISQRLIIKERKMEEKKMTGE